MMPKSRTSVPSTNNDGIWFRTRGWSDPPLMRETMTSTGHMLSTTMKEEQPTIPHPPPKEFDTKMELTYSMENPFSLHNNRHSLQDHGVYFGHGLGKRLFRGEQGQHSSKDFYTWDARSKETMSLSTNYGDSFTGRPCKEPPNRRRFPRQYPQPNVGPKELETKATDWFQAPYVPYKTETQTLVSSQEPHIKPNPWRYSYKAY